MELAILFQHDLQERALPSIVVMPWQSELVIEASRTSYAVMLLLAFPDVSGTSSSTSNVWPARCSKP